MMYPCGTPHSVPRARSCACFLPWFFLGHAYPIWQIEAHRFHIIKLTGDYKRRDG